MKKSITFLCVYCCIFYACKTDPKEQDKETMDTTTKVTEETNQPKQGANTFGETTEAFLESIGADEAVKEEYLQKLKEMEGMSADSSGMVTMLEALMAEAIEREKVEGKAEEKRQRRLSGNMDDLTAAFEKLNAESGVEATIAKLKKVDSMTGQNSFQVLDMDQETIDQMKETSKKSSPKKESPPKGKMTREEMDMMRDFTRPTATCTARPKWTSYNSSSSVPTSKKWPRKTRSRKPMPKGRGRNSIASSSAWPQKKRK